MARLLLALLVLAAAATPAWAAPAKGSVAADVASSTCPLTWTHTIEGGARGLLVYVTVVGNGTDQVSAADVGGTNIPEVAGSPNLKATGEADSVNAFYLGAAVPTGAQTITVACTAGATKQGVSVTVTASADTELVDVDVTINSDAQSNPTVTLSAGGRTVLAAIGFYSGQGDPTSITPLTDWTADSETDLGAATTAVYTFDTIGTSDVTAGWTQAADDAVAIAVAVAEVAAPGAASRRWMMMGVGR